MVARWYFLITFKKRWWPNLITFQSDFFVSDKYTLNHYLVHIRALLSLYQINTDKCIHILLNHHFIDSYMSHEFKP